MSASKIAAKTTVKSPIGFSLPFFSAQNAKVHPSICLENPYPIEQTIPIDGQIIEGRTSYTGHILHGKKHGKGIYVDRHAHVEYNGEWENDHIHGSGTIRNYFNQTQFTGKFENNRMVYGTMTWPDRTIYTGYFEDNEPSGVGRIRWPNNARYEGMFVDGKISGFGMYTNSAGKVEDREF